MTTDQNQNDGSYAACDPIFIVGAPRSGTTMLSVILDRHPHICIPPETQFFTAFLPSLPGDAEAMTTEELVQFALESPRIKDLKLDKQHVLDHFSTTGPQAENLFAALLMSYSKKQGKIRYGEKSPGHLNHIPQILAAFPKAKIICIVRDGRDVVRSLLKVKWAEPENPRRFWLFCMQWNDLTRLALQYFQTMAQEQFHLVKYEEILTQPEREIVKICAFLGEQFYPSQLSGTAQSGVVPEWEQSWKGNAVKALDQSRISAWRNSASQEQIWAMNCMMGKTLAAAGYNETGMQGCPLQTRLKYNLIKLPFIKWLRPLSLFVLKVTKSVKV